MQPPLLPAETLARLLRLAKLDGTSILVISGAFALVSAAMGDRLGALVALMVAAAGAIELHGAGLIRAGDVRGLRWLLASQLYLLTVILGYVAMRLLTYDPTIINLVMTPSLRARYTEAGLQAEEIDRIVQWSYYLSHALFGIISLAYQGGLAFYYARRRTAIAAALAAPDHPA